MLPSASTAAYSAWSQLRDLAPSWWQTRSTRGWSNVPLLPFSALAPSLMCENTWTTWPTLWRSFSLHFKREVVNPVSTCLDEYVLCHILHNFGSNRIDSILSNDWKKSGFYSMRRFFKRIIFNLLFLCFWKLSWNLHSNCYTSVAFTRISTVLTDDTFVSSCLFSFVSKSLQVC